jgi:opacity protein-like surface antigen
MRAFRARVLTSLLTIGLFAAASANAAERGLYVGFLYGDSSKEYDTERFDWLATQIYQQFDYVPTTRSPAKSEDGESYGFLVGYRFNQYLALEGGYTYLTKQVFRETSSGFFIPGGEEEPAPEDWTLSFTSRSNGFMLSVLGILPINYSWEAYARAGAFFASNEMSVYVNPSTFPNPLGSRFTESSTDWLAGVGISMSIAEIYAIRAEFTRIFDAGEPAFGQADVDLITIGVTVSF